MKLFRMERKVSNKLGNLFTVTSCLWQSLRNEEVSPVTCYRIKPFAVALPLVLIIFCFSFVEHNFVINRTIISFISFASVCVCVYRLPIVRRAHAAELLNGKTRFVFHGFADSREFHRREVHFIQPAIHSRFLSSYSEVRWHLIPLETNSHKAPNLDRQEKSTKTLKAKLGREIFLVYIELKQYKQKCSRSLCLRHPASFGKLCRKMFANF